MILRMLQGPPAKTVPVAMMFVTVGMAILAVAIAWPRYLSQAAHIGADWSDFLRGAMYGIAIAFEAIGLVIAVAAAAAGRTEKARGTDPAPRS
jgi:hypothetical protein